MIIAFFCVMFGLITTVMSLRASSFGYSGRLARETWLMSRSVRSLLVLSSTGMRKSRVGMLPRMSTSPSPALMMSMASWVILCPGGVSTMV